MKKLLLAVFGLATLFILFLYIYIKNLDEGEIKRLLIHQVEQKIDGKLTIGSFSLKGLRELSMKNVELKSQFDREILKVKEISLRLSLMDLIRSKLRITGLYLTEPSIFVWKDKNSKWNFETLLKQTAKQPASSLPKLSTQAKVEPVPIEIEEFSLDQTRIFVNEASPLNLEIVGSVRNEIIHLKSFLFEYLKQSKVRGSGTIPVKADELDFKLSECKLVLEDFIALLGLDHQLSGVLEAYGDLHLGKSRITPNLDFSLNGLKYGSTGQLQRLSGKLMKESFQIDGNLVQNKEHYHLKLNGSYELKKEIEKTQFHAKWNMTAKKDLSFSGEITWQNPMIYLKDGRLSKTPIEAGFEGFYTPKTKKGALSYQGKLSSLEKIVKGLNFPLVFDGKVSLEPGNNPRGSLRVGAQTVQYQFIDLGTLSGGGTFQVDEQNFLVSKDFKLRLGQRGAIEIDFSIPKESPGAPNGKVNFQDISILASIPLKDGKPQNINLVLEQGDLNLNGKQYSLVNLRGSVQGSPFQARASGNLDDPMKPRFSLSTTNFPAVLAEPRLEPFLIDAACNYPVQCSLALKEKRNTSVLVKASLPVKLKAPYIDGLKLDGQVNLSSWKGFFPEGFGLKGIVDVNMQPTGHELSLTLVSKSLEIKTSVLEKEVLLTNLKSTWGVEPNLQNVRLEGLNANFASGQVGATGNFLPLDLKNFASLEVSAKELDLNQVSELGSAGMKDQFLGKIDCQIPVLKFGLLPEGTSTIAMQGNASVKSPVYAYPKSIVDFLGGIEQGVKSGLIAKLAAFSKKEWQIRSSQTARFKDLNSVQFSFDGALFSVPYLQLEEIDEGYFLQSTRPFEVILDKNAKEPRLAAGWQLTLREAFLKEKFSFLKESKISNMQETLKFDGPVSDPIPSSELSRIKSTWVKNLLGMVNFKALGKSLEGKVSDLKDNFLEKNSGKLIEKGNSFIEKVLGTKNSSEGSTKSTSDPMKKLEDKAKKKLKSFLGDLF